MFSPSVTAEGEVNSLGVGDMLSSSAKPHSLYIYIERGIYNCTYILRTNVQLFKKNSISG